MPNVNIPTKHAPLFCEPHSSDAEAVIDLSIVIVSFNTVHLLERLFAALSAARGNLKIQIIVVDNASTDGSATILRTTYPEVELIENNSNVGFGRANNQAVALAKGRYILLLNTDAFVAPEALSKTVEFMELNPRIGVLGVKLVGRDGALQPSCRYFPTPWNVFLKSTGLMRFSPNTRLVDDMDWDHNSVRVCDWVPGCYYLTRREVIEKLGLFDPLYFLYYEEVDHCRRVQSAGWQIVYYPDTQVIHIGGESAASTGTQVDRHGQIPPLQIESELLYFRKHHGVLGLTTAVCLTILADAAFLVRRLAPRRDRIQARDAMHSISVIKTLLDTKFGSRPTR